jgi:hypothetical protein
MARGTEFGYAPGNIFYALGAANGSTAVFLNKKSHDMLCVEYAASWLHAAVRARCSRQTRMSRHSMPDKLTLHVKWEVEIGEADNFNRLQRRKLNYMQ